MSDLKVVAHVGRDIMQSAQLFRTPEAAVWEYVVNSLQYVEPGIVAHVEVGIDLPNKRITIRDNGSGMDVEGLQHYFTMHGENRERRKGVPGRGKFGTGKSAAFGIGKSLAVSTTRNGKRQTVKLTRAAIDASDGTSVPVQVIEQDASAEGDPNGTTVEIDGISVRLAKEPIITLIERHLSAFRGSPVVTVNGRVCEGVRPTASITRMFTPTPQQAAVLGDVTLSVSASPAPLDEIQRGVQITVGPDNLVGVETAGVDSKEYGRQLFGHVDCSELENPKYDPVAAYTTDRSMKLNTAHPVAVALIAFIGASLERVRQELVVEGKKAKADADAKRLRETADKVQQILNADLKEFRDTVEPLGNTIRRRTPLEGDAGGNEVDPGQKIVDPAGDEKGREDGVGGESIDNPIPTDDPTPDVPPAPGPGKPGGGNASAAATPDPEGDQQIARAGAGRSRLRGGLSVEFAEYGADFDRYFWDQEKRAIFVNTDHPVVRAARALPDNGVSFDRLVYEIAFTAYAIALADMQFERDPARDSGEATVEIRAALRRVWAHAGALYAI